MSTYLIVLYVLSVVVMVAKMGFYVTDIKHPKKMAIAFVAILFGSIISIGITKLLFF